MPEPRVTEAAPARRYYEPTEEDANPRLPQESLGHPMTTGEDDPLDDDPPDEGILNAWAGEEDARP